jgi:type 1 glutamine amidotransferase
VDPRIEVLATHLFRPARALDRGTVMPVVWKTNYDKAGCSSTLGHRATVEVPKWPSLRRGISWAAREDNSALPQS